VQVVIDGHPNDALSWEPQRRSLRCQRAPEGNLPAIPASQPQRRARHPKGRSEAEEARSALTSPERRLLARSVATMISIGRQSLRSPDWGGSEIERRAYGLRDEEYLRLKVLTTMLPPLGRKLARN
jgi:hypothetical protein